MYKIILILCMSFLSACTASVTRTYTPNGDIGYTLNCSGTIRGWDKCLKTAGDICGSRGYDILDRSEESTIVAGASQYDFFATKTNERTMLISCKK